MYAYVLLQTDSGHKLIKHYGKEGILAELKKVKSNLDPCWHSLLNKVVDLIEKSEDQPSVTPRTYVSDGSRYSERTEQSNVANNYYAKSSTRALSTRYKREN